MYMYIYKYGTFENRGHAHPSTLAVQKKIAEKKRKIEAMHVHERSIGTPKCPLGKNKSLEKKKQKSRPCTSMNAA